MDARFLYRRACQNDQQQIRRLSEGIYNGTDYFSHVFLDLLLSPIWYVYVAKDTEEGHIVAATCILAADGGNTLIWRFSRVRPSHRGNKLIKALNSFALHDVKGSTNYPILRQRGMYTADALKRYPNIICNPTVLRKCETCCFVIDCQAANKYLFDKNIAGRELLPLEFDNLLKSRDVTIYIASVLPEGILTITSDCFTLLEISDEDKTFLRSRKLGFLYNNTANNNNFTNLSILDETTINTELNEAATISAIYWEPWRYNNNRWGVAMSIYGCRGDNVFCYIMYVLDVLVNLFSKEKEVQLTVAFYEDKTHESFQYSHLVKNWANSFGTSWIHCKYCSDLMLMETYQFN